MFAFGFKRGKATAYGNLSGLGQGNRGLGAALLAGSRNKLGNQKRVQKFFQSKGLGAEFLQSFEDLLNPSKKPSKNPSQIVVGIGSMGGSGYLLYSQSINDTLQPLNGLDNSYFGGINKFGNIVGTYTTNNIPLIPFYYSSPTNQPIYLSSLSQTLSYCLDINNKKNIVGYTNNRIPLYWENPDPNTLPIELELPHDNYTNMNIQFVSLNDHGNIITNNLLYWDSHSDQPTEVQYQPDLYYNVTITSINNAGIIVGIGNDINNDNRLVFLYWTDHTDIYPKKLTMREGTQAQTYISINNSNEIVGIDADSTHQTQCIYWSSLDATPIPIFEPRTLEQVPYSTINISD